MQTNLAIPKNCVVGDPAYSDGETIWVISKEEMARESLKKPDDGAELAAFYKTHADGILGLEKSTTTNVDETQSKTNTRSEPAGENR